MQQYIVSDGKVREGIAKESGKPYRVQTVALDSGDALGAERCDRFAGDRDGVIPAGRFAVPSGIRAFVRDRRLEFTLDVASLKPVSNSPSFSATGKAA